MNNGKNCNNQFCEPFLISTSITTLIYAAIMTYLLPLLFKAYIVSADSVQAMPSSQIISNMSNYYHPFTDLSSFLIFLTFSKFSNNIIDILAKIPSMTTSNSFSVSLCLFLFSHCFKINYSFINCFLYTFCCKLCLTITLSNVNHIKYAKQCGIFYLIATLFLFLVVVSNMSLLNPGPEHDGLSCFFQNVQGFVTLNSIHKQHPDLNITKLIEFQTHIFENSPDIILLNETWLKPTINDSEIIPSDNYRIFRRDRSPDSHPPDPENPNKFKAIGGGVLKTAKNSLNLKPKEIKTTCKAELLSVDLTFPSRNKYSLSTLYRVGTLGYNHICKVESHFYSIFSSKKYKKNFIIGDLNLESIDWSSSTASNRTQSSYLNLFSPHAANNKIHA